ncbi:hypothetical protein [Saccharopolyspora gloriosae]|uniref:Uncharacterized protein n=1 Tax=Saccharopolyspora gloriosae TaxID=455344 RepID=A0A840NTF4_9PSEU|nr:hypothetical protein [Saccharopolyspora gloriosae]MBB5071467.1 hypothetical protein [Saccharopolyspora gloriosae]
MNASEAIFGDVFEAVSTDAAALSATEHSVSVENADTPTSAPCVITVAGGC